MNFRKITIPGRRILRKSRFLQVLLLILFWMVGEALSRWLRLPIPGGVVGLLVLTALLVSGSFSYLNLRRGAEWFLAEMLLFFIPAVPAVLNHRELFSWVGLKVLVVILAGTAIVMVVTAVVVDLCFHWEARRQASKDTHS